MSSRSRGCLGTFVFMLFLIGAAYLAVGLFSYPGRNTGLPNDVREYWNRKPLETRIEYMLTWPTGPERTHAEYREYREGRKQVSTYVEIVSAAKPQAAGDAASIQRRHESGELDLHQAVGMLEGIGDPLLGRGATSRIVNITLRHQQGGMSDESYVRGVLNEVTTGLPRGLDAFVKRVAGRAAHEILKNP